MSEAQYYSLGGLFRVRRMGYGAMRLTGQPGNFGPYKDWEAGKRLLRRALELGINHLDTAFAYGPGYSEELIADALHPYPKDLVIATKGGIEKPEPGKVFADGRPETLRAHLEASLRRLRLECIQMYYLHRPDPNVPFEDSVGELANMRAEGKIQLVALSNVKLEQIKQAQTIVPIAAIQNRYNVDEAGDDHVLEYARDHGMAFVPWGPLGAQPFSAEAPLAKGFADGALTPSQVALRALLDRAANVLPIPGTTSLRHLEENAAVVAS